MKPARLPRDVRSAGRLLHVDVARESVTDRAATELPQWLAPGDLLVLEARQRIAARYEVALANLDEIETLAARPGLLHAHHLFAVLLRLDRLSIDRAQFIKEMKARGAVCSVHWRPLHMHAYYRDTYGYRPEDFPVAASLWPRLVSLPLFPSMSEEEIEHVIDAVVEICTRFGVKGR